MKLFCNHNQEDKILKTFEEVNYMYHRYELKKLLVELSATKKRGLKDFFKMYFYPRALGVVLFKRYIFSITLLK